MEKEAQKDITQWRREQETSLREGIEAFRRTTHQRELKENLEFVQFKRERKRRAREAELELITQSYDAQREKSIQRENCEKERITADEVFKAEQREDREETRKLVRALRKEEARKEQAERLYNSAEKMEYEKRQLLAEKNRRIKDLQLMSALCRRGRRRRLRKLGESGATPADIETVVKKEHPVEDQRPRHRPVKVRPILPVERLASLKNDAGRAVFGSNESPFRPKSLAFPTTKFAPKRPDARTVGSGDPALAKTIGKIAKEMHVSSEDEPMPSSVKVILMNAMKVSAEEKKRRKEKIERSSLSQRVEDRKRGQRLVEKALDDVAFGAIDSGIQESSGAAQLFLESSPNVEGEERPALKQDKFFLIQLPNTFPRVVAEKEEEESKPRAKGSLPPAPEQEVSSFSDVPDGKIGTLRIHKSGRVSLLIGNIEYSCALGQKPKFAQEVACVLPTQGEAVFMGEIEDKLIVSPKI
ncbi:conserved hypothetical protein [Perkinsus marinus ATCC 50983]|uniref:Uncharacterized protein n=1 Tax=Perkinsus marinus (strain ATCC 50983 / TXsc) TaxID=423536 RepID=C5KCH9_PERM5|nr:conserved hypothetical protein [Perkinsus marinus ATCC 50983]EER17841.1 conserved hypothetical protein [Perkinsus marinus ATCC 50983]|eukprot:XP_002786045.1 conserved hypothetical protein [Perkinsus marinus ATCC 50983]